MPTYDATVDPGATNTSHALMLELIGVDKTVLDIGCATGYLAQALTARGCTVSGVEMDPTAAEAARPHLAQLVVGDLTQLDLAAELAPHTYDVIVLGDVLEHLPEPVPVLRSVTSLLAPGGSVVISVPNVAHGSVRLALLQGRWEYRDRGLLDSTHLRFLTRTSLRALVRDAGLTVVDLRTTTLDPLAGEVLVDAGALPDGVVDWVRTQPDALTYQFVLRAMRDDADGVLTAVTADRERIEERAADLGAELERTRAERDAAIADRARIEETLGWRLLRAPRRAYGELRRRVRP
ncbi:methyltransferase domain-containing protein [Cellulomonas sp. SLBN-39]|uniref:methyltransferase domain-containing protein n=1 Tax=Cellulomonas sp. SLBN-39 TaxID=2768446 RepID=UPI00114E6013|nr:methyltransferase domain-containing protein [Cellulomonas sp. SLBN-39]TQL03669.1 methyltransferase family protein [Cellulomonas sp. SLBN-39]